MNTKDQPQAEPKVSVRDQRRAEAVEKEAAIKFTLLTNRLLDLFTESTDPTSDELKAKHLSISAQWKAYCKVRRLNKEALMLVDRFFDTLLKDYNEGLTPQPEAPIPSTEVVEQPITQQVEGQEY